MIAIKASLHDMMNEYAVSPLHLPKVARAAIPNVIPPRLVKEHVGVSRPAPILPSTSISSLRRCCLFWKQFWGKPEDKSLPQEDSHTQGPQEAETSNPLRQSLRVGSGDF